MEINRLLLLTDEHHYYKTCADKYYNGKNTYPGFAYSIKEFPYEGITLDIRFRVEIEDNLFAGICIYDTTNKREFIPKDNSILSELGKYVKKITIGDSYWISWIYLPISSRDLTSNCRENLKGSDIVPNFKYMNEAAIKLFDDNEMNCFVEKCVVAIKKFLDNTIIDNNHNS